MRLLIVSICLVVASLTASAQNVVVKTNLLYDITATANLGIEFKVAPKWTVDISGNLNAWTFSDNKKWKHWVLQPEARYWLCERFNGHFVGAHLVGGIYNMGNWNTDFTFLGTDFGQLKEHRYEGWLVGAGIAYGYHWMLGRHWSVEAEIGIGYVYTQADKYECPRCGEQLENNKPHHYVGPTKAAVNLIYVF
ncbi:MULTISPECIES: DUF3575 domain-containing protein [Bacteroidaceae]|uniref:DUF3575 domain-containing protein n=1 Tax=Phocaeicola intestinalis TaxID=2762212 RepID=A0ABR8Y9B7_9BACT|nr:MULTISPECIES: DUF3575 domain-containing protein [Bacteroidaceae]MBD8040790.1 DUF3575 domain-containing protein [Phocaeicola intestinalis]MBM6657307.1 DUF3575 domain-containing protein [Bacteroides gallinaceum]OUN81494.1 hypothetical protein B5G04_04230 [Bacteroides sp. An51A]OUP29461.1 hypothetical protein B5F25_16175 [Bacteroides sp. An19]